MPGTEQTFRKCLCVNRKSPWGCIFCDSLSYLFMELALVLCPASVNVGGGKRISFMFKVSKHLPGLRSSSLENSERLQTQMSVPSNGLLPVSLQEPCSATLLELCLSSSLASRARLLLNTVHLPSQCLSALACVLHPMTRVCPAWISVIALQLAADGNSCSCELLHNNNAPTLKYLIVTTTTAGSWGVYYMPGTVQNPSLTLTHLILIILNEVCIMIIPIVQIRTLLGGRSLGGSVG